MGKVLIVEDSRFINKVISNRLKKEGFQVDNAYSLQEADDYIYQNNYDFIILDLHLPDGEGIDIITNVQSMSNSKIIVLSSLKDDYLREELFKFGILDYIVKDRHLNYSLEELLKILKKAELKDSEKILLVDDSKVVHMQVKKVLIPRNYIVKSVYTGEQAINLIKKEKFSLIILDITLPDMNGVDVLEKIREVNSKVPVIVLSGTADAATVRKILKNGANDYIKKPFIFEEFLLKVDLLIDHYRQSLKLEELNQELEKKVKQQVEELLEKDRILSVQSRLAEMGSIINMISHQWKQPLNVISVTVGRIFINYKKGKDIDNIINDCYKTVNLQIENLVETLHTFMDFFKPDKNIEKFDLYEAIRNSVKLVETVLKKENINLKVNIEENILIKGFKNEFSQALLNIINNAKDAFSDKDLKEKIIKICTTKKGNFIYLHIEDNAGGIPEKIIDKIFEPYFSTKSNSGTGLGLYIAKLIIKKHMNGKLTVENTSEGAKFTIKLKTYN
ncbi:hybrid sensor histidine kinase/response regulator [Persephonella atlantica]|uniref:histidine kinase n=1 Tax=Persephonella atlantica TaxID=2699429 RepID=A0ABS1GIM9_9AQUI|nr:response regulator [Persephonella atlantica]MBK3332791.1 hybrid sensor histidine kinase/response regulator [Persephonella atlantica]